MSEQQQHTRTLYVFECANCGITMGVPQQFIDARRIDGRDFYCPNGHTLSYTPSENKKLRDQLARTTAQLDQERACCREKSERLNELSTRLVKTRAGYRGQIARQRKATK